MNLMKQSIMNCFMSKKYGYPGIEEGKCAGLRTLDGQGEPCKECKSCLLQYQHEKEKIINKCKCGTEIPYYRTLCDECSEKENFKKAEKIKFKDYDYDIIFNQCTDEFCTIDEFYEYYEENDTKPPSYVYACIPIRFSLDMYDVVENELEQNHYEGAFDNINLDTLKDLQQVVSKWTEKQDITSWEQDYNTVILLETAGENEWGVESV